MQLFVRTIKSFTRKEKLAAVLFLAVFTASLYTLLVGNPIAGTSKSKTYSEGIVGQITHLNPVYTEFSEADADIAPLLFSGLVKYDAVSEEFEEDIATLQLSEDQLSYTFTLKNGVLWHDGIEMTAEDLYFTFHDVIQSEDFKNPILKANFDGVKVEMPNSRTITFTLNSPNSFFLSSLYVGILPKHILENVPVSELDTNEFNRQPIGSGPFQVLAPYEENSDGSTSVTLTRFDQYYGELPGIETIRFIAYPNSAELAENRDVWHSAARIQQNLLDDLDLEQLVTHRYELPQYTALFINTDSIYLDERAERQAVSYAIDKSAILNAIGYKVQIDSPLLELDDPKQYYAYDSEAAKEALIEAEWTEDNPLTLRLVRRDFSTENAAQEKIQATVTDLIVQQLNTVGIQVNVETYPIADLQSVIQERDYDLLLYGQSVGYNLDIFSYWHSSQVSESGLNLSNYQNPKADYYMESIRGTTDEEEHVELVESLAEIIAEDVPAIFLYTPSYYYLTDVGLTGVEFKKLLHPRDRFSNIESWNFN